MMNSKTIHYSILAGFLLLAACNTEREQQLALLEGERPVEELYNAALDASQAGKHKSAAELFEEVERQHPYSQWATQAQLLYGFTLYEDQQYDEAIAALERFIDLNPTHPEIPYAFYLKALCYYERITDVGRDQQMTEDALDNLRQVVRRFPKTPYARDANLKIDLTLDHLAGKEMEVGRFYQRRGSHVAAIRRFQVVVDSFQTTSHVAEALHRLTESNLALGLTDEAKRNAAVLGHNYPGSDWYQYSFDLLQQAGVAE